MKRCPPSLTTKSSALAANLRYWSAGRCPERCLSMTVVNGWPRPRAAAWCMVASQRRCAGASISGLLYACRWARSKYRSSANGNSGMSRS